MGFLNHSKLLIEESPLQLLPSLAVAIGLDEAIFVQQLHYRLKSSRQEEDGRIWFRHSTEEWAEEFPFFSISTIKRIISGLRTSGIILTRSDLNQHAFDRSLWFAIDYEKLDSLILNQSSAEIELSSVENEQSSAEIRQSTVSDWDEHSVNLSLSHSVNLNQPIIKERELKEEKGEAAPPASATPSEPEPPKPSKVSEYVKAYEHIWGQMVASPMRGEQIAEWEKRVTLDGWKYALKETADQNKRGAWKYLESILARIEQEGYVAPSPKTPTNTTTVVDFSLKDLGL